MALSAPTPPFEPRTATRVFLRPIANPFALGFLGLAGATVTVSGTELGWIPPAEIHQAAAVVLVFAPLLQTIACVFGFLGRDAVAATGMGVLAGAWACVGVVLLVAPPGATSHALGTFLFAAAAGLLVTAGTAAQTKLVPALVILTTALRFCVTAVYQLTGSEAWQDAAGYTGLVLGFLAVYAAASLETEDIRRRTVLPTLRRARGRAVMEGDLEAQIEKLANEAGIREQL